MAIDVVPEPERQRLWRHFLLEESPIQGSLNQDGKTSSPHWSLEQEQSEELGWCMDSQAWKSESSTQLRFEVCFVLNFSNLSLISQTFLESAATS